MAAMGEEVKRIGGLHVIGSERHDARRIDLQLRGRCGRQGDPGSSRFFLSLDDDLMRIFAGPFVKRVLEMGGFKDDVPIESRMVSRRIEAAQKKREEYNYEIRKSLLEYDEVMDEQRKRIYSFRQRILDGVSCREIVQDMIQDQVETNLETCLAEDFGAESFARFAGKQLTVDLEPHMFKRLAPEEAVAVCLEEAERQAETDILQKIDENLALGEEESEWNWGALAHFVNSRWNINIREKDLKASGRDFVDEMLINKARAAIRKAKIEGADQMLDPDYGIKTAAGWVGAKFGIEVDPNELRDLTLDSSVDLVNDRALDKYSEKEAVYPVMAGMYRFVAPSNGGATGRIDREGLTQWASRRFESEITIEDLKNKQREEIHELLVDKSRHSQKEAQTCIQSLQGQIEQVSESGGVPLLNANGEANRISGWFKENLNHDLHIEAVERLEKVELEQKLEAIVEDHYHPEIRRMERMVLLEIVDSAWKDHLLAMDYLRSAVGQRGIAQLDPKVEYKREGMRMFEGLWTSIGERVTDLIFRMEQINEEFVSHTLIETSARHDEVQEVHQEPMQQSDMEREQSEAIDNSGRRKTVETIRNRDVKVGRNDPCTCGSGKKYKSCCMRKR